MVYVMDLDNQSLANWTAGIEKITADVNVTLDQLSTAVLVCDREHKLLHVNTAAEALLDTSAAKLKQASVEQLFPRNTALMQAISQAIEAGRSFAKRDISLRRRQSDEERVDCIISPWRGEGGKSAGALIELVSTARYRRIQTENAMVLQNRATAALMQGLAHEIKNPLGGIRGATQLLERELSDGGLREFTQVIIEEADRLRKLVDRMLAPSRTLCTEEISIHEILEHVHRLVALEAPSRVSIMRDYDPSLPNIAGDRDSLVQVFMNLLRNALQALRDGGGTITLRTRAERQFTIGTILHRVVLRVDIIDDGPGVAPDIAEQIFLPMVSGSSSGSGLGLPIAQALVDRHSGFVSFSSTPGRTVFSVWLPIAASS